MDEKMRILKMLEEGTITAEQAAELMDALNIHAAPPAAPPPAPHPLPPAVLPPSGYDKLLFHVIVDTAAGDEVNIKFPVGAIKKILKATGKLPIPDSQLQDVDLSELMGGVCECLDGEVEGDFVNVSQADGTTVRIYVGK